MSARYVITAAYGRCLEGWRSSREDLERALAACKYAGRDSDNDPEVARCVADMRDWARLQRETPRFVEGSPA